jgi:L-seryl-tRNA(Ser) seleniumtransferase
MTESRPDVYARLGLTRVINAADTYTVLGGGPLSAPVLEAMAQASSGHVRIIDLFDAIGARIADLSGNEAALVTSGAGTAVVLAVAAAVAGKAPGAIEAVPDHRGDKREVIVLCAQRNQYDRMVRIAGGVLREVGYSDSTTDWQLRDAINERTAAILWFAGTQFENYALSFETVVSIGREAGVAVIVDAAAQFPPSSNLGFYTGNGADAVAFSGGKGLRGPQNTGLLLGKKDFIETARLHAFPRAAIGRPMKVSKEDACGLLAAVEVAFSLDEAAEYARYQGQCEEIVAALAGKTEVKATVVPTGHLGQHYPRVRVDLTGPDDADAVTNAFAANPQPIIVARDALLARTIFINPFNLAADELGPVIEAAQRILR